MAAMGFAANPPMRLWRVCSIWTMFFNSSFTVSISGLFLSRILSRRGINEFCRTGETVNGNVEGFGMATLKGNSSFQLSCVVDVFVFGFRSGTCTKRCYSGNVRKESSHRDWIWEAMCGVRRLRPSSRLLRGWEVVLWLCFLPITGAEARLSTVCGVVRLMLLGKNTKNMENAKELTKKYGSSGEEIAII